MSNVTLSFSSYPCLMVGPRVTHEALPLLPLWMRCWSVWVKTIRSSLSLSLCHPEGGGSVRVLFTPVLFESFHFNSHAFTVSSRLQITSFFFNLDVSIFRSLCCLSPPPSHVARVCCYNARDSARRFACRAPCPVGPWFHGRAPPGPGDALWGLRGKIPHARSYPWSSTPCSCPGQRSWDFSLLRVYRVTLHKLILEPQLQSHAF